MGSVAARLDPVSPLALLVLRIGVGTTMAWHGWQKFDGGVANFAGFVESVGLPAPTVLAWVVSILEFVGGGMIVAGLLTRVPAALITLQMIGTAFYVKASQLGTGFIAAEGVGFELDIVLLAGAFAIAVLGPGAISLDRALGFEGATSRGVSPTARPAHT